MARSNPTTTDIEIVVSGIPQLWMCCTYNFYVNNLSYAIHVVCYFCNPTVPMIGWRDFGEVAGCSEARINKGF
jgi:hypothetical protein